MAMPTETPRILLRLNYYEAAQEYLHNLPPEHFMEAIPQATQREITVESLALVRVHRPDIQYFNELLVQYPHPNPESRRPGQVVPDNMVVVHTQPIEAEGSYDVPLQPARPFWMLEYVSKSNKRKDYDDNMRKYEHELKVPYYLLFAPDVQELTLYRHTGEKYLTVIPNGNGRLALQELELEVALSDGWVRFWFRGKLLPLPAELLQQLQHKDEQLQHKDEQLQHKNEQPQHKDEQLRQAQRRIEEEKQASLAAERRAEEERRRAETLATELDRLRQQLAQRGA
jgi:Uma2 family endonuclease